MSFHANQLIEEFIDIVDDDRYEDTEIVLQYLNQSQRALADLLLLPDLKNGNSTVNTVVGAYKAPLPDDFNRNIYLAFSGGKTLNTHMDLVSFNKIVEGISLDTGDVTGVTDFGTDLIYQNVPSSITAIDLFYYRLPTDMTEDDTSFPEGIAGNDDFDWALIHLAAAKAFDRIEDGMEGAKVNTESHKAKAAERIALLDQFCEKEGELYPYRPDAGMGWMGVR